MAFDGIGLLLFPLDEFAVKLVAVVEIMIKIGGDMFKIFEFLRLEGKDIFEASLDDLRFGGDS